MKKSFKTGEIIIPENGNADGMYIIEEGLVRIFKTIPGKAGPMEMELVQLGPRSLFGEMAMIDNQRRSASVQALEDTVCTVISKEMFNGQLKQLPKWVTTLIQVLVARLRDTNEKLRERAKSYLDDTGPLMYIDDNENSQAREMKEILEDAMKVLDRNKKAF